MIIPILIQYSQNNLNSLGKSPDIIFKSLQGKHKCYFHYSDFDKNKKIRIHIAGHEWGIIVEQGRDHLCFQNPWFRKENTMRPVKEEDGIIQECEIIFSNNRQGPVSLLLDNGYASNLPEIREFIIRCGKIKKPITPVHKEREKEIWTAYCEGLNALSKERRNFIPIDTVGSPILFKDFRKGEIFTLKLGTTKSNITNLISNTKKILNNKYRIDDVSLTNENKFIDIRFKGTEKIIDDDLNDLNDYLLENGFRISDEGVSNILKTSISYLNHSKRIDLYDNLDEELLKANIVFSNNKDLVYCFTNDSDSIRFLDIASKVFGDIAKPILKRSISVPIDLNKEVKEVIKEKISSHKQIRLINNQLVFSPNSLDDYELLKTIASKILSEFKADLTYPKYIITGSLTETELSDTYRQRRMNYADEELSIIKKNASHYEYDGKIGRVIRIEFRFKCAEERENIFDTLSSIVKNLGNDYLFTNKNRYGFTTIRYIKCDSEIQQIEDDLRTNYQNEEIKLVNGRFYNENFKKISDPENIIEPNLKQLYNRFINECPVIGICHKRTTDSIIVNLNEDFYNGESMIQQIHPGDMIFFPSVGSSTDLRRQYEAIQRINNPGTKAANNRKIIEPPVNPKLCDFLFSPLYARDIKSNITEMMESIRLNKLESHLNEKQIEAVAKAVLAEDIAFIQGPPGTGKTTVIAEIIWQEIRRNPKCRILLTSQTNLAVDNALERIKYKKAIRPLRVISDQRNDRDDIIYNSNLLDTWVKSPNDYNKDNVVEIWIDSIIDKIDRNINYKDIVKEWRDYLFQKDLSLRSEFVEKYKSNVNLIASTCSLCGSQQFRQIFFNIYNCEDVNFDVVIMDEASKATPLEMAIPMVLGKKIVVIGDHKQLPPLLDEGSIDIALQKIGRNDLAEKIQDFKESQFKKLFLMAQKFKPNLITTLDTQYRMHSDIMKTINHFYSDELGDKGLKCGIEKVQDEENFELRGSRWHGISNEPFITPSTHAIWVNVDGVEEKEYTSFKNYDEINAVKTVVKALTRSQGFSRYIHSQKRIEDKEIGLITFYSAQKRELKQLEQSGLLDSHYDYRIDVVDRFQGMERNIIIVSTVRSNKFNGIGFAKEIERINVAFSRAKSLLIVVGNRDLFSTKLNYKASIDAMETINIKQLEHLLDNEEYR